NTAKVIDAKHVALNYTLSNRNVTQPLGLLVYQSDQPSVDGSSVLLGQQTIDPSSDSADLSQGNHTVSLALSTPIASDQTKPYVVVVANPDGSVPEAPGSVNVVSTRALTLPDVVVDSISTTDSRSLTVDYHIDFADVTAPLTIDFYRSPTPKFDP